jgi:hypothetical protein
MTSITPLQPTSPLYPNNTDIIYNNFLKLDPDFYQYSIERTVNSWNLTVALKNYLWQDPSVSVPVKIMIGWVVRTITSPLSVYHPSWENYFNAWSSELATKEIDYFLNLMINSSSGNIYLWASRFIGNIGSDFVQYPQSTNEKFLPYVDNIASTDPVINIWRFNATLSNSWSGYQWSIPATSDIRNYPVFETRELECVPLLSWSSWSAGSYAETGKIWRYKIVWDQCFFKFWLRVTNVWSWTWDSRLKTPFWWSNSSDFILWSWWIMNWNNWTFKTIITSYSQNAEYLNFANNIYTVWGQYSVINANDVITWNVNYKI